MEHRVSEPDNPESVQSQDGGQDNPDRDHELAETRERLAFYESFDSLIQDNVRRSGELLRQVAAEREAVENRLREVDAEREAVERRLVAMRAELDERQAEQRRVLGEIASSLGEVEAHIGGIASRVSQSLESLATQAAAMPLDGDAQEVLGSQPDQGTDGGTEMAGELSGADGDHQSETVARPDYEALDPGAAAADTPSGPPIGETGTQGEVQAPTPTGAMNGVVAAPVEAPPITGPRTIDVVIHGVAKAATALSIQRYLQNLPGVSTVEVREYVSGVLRIQVVATTLSPEDLRRWEGGADLQTMTAQQNVLELKLPGAEGL